MPPVSCRFIIYALCLLFPAGAAVVTSWPSLFAHATISTGHNCSSSLKAHPQPLAGRQKSASDPLRHPTHHHHHHHHQKPTACILFIVLIFRLFFLYFFAMLGRLGSPLHCIYAIINREGEKLLFNFIWLTIFEHN